MLKHGFALIFTMILCGLQAQDAAEIRGVISNPTGEMVTLSKVEFADGKRSVRILDSAALDSQGRFVLRPALDKLTTANFSDGNEVFEILLAPGDDMEMSLNTRYFDETLDFQGKGAEKNNALVSLYLIDEAFTTQLLSQLDLEEPDTTKMFLAYEKHSESFSALIRDYMEALPDFAAHGEKKLELEERKAVQLKNYVRNEIVFRKKIRALQGKQAIDFKGVNLDGDTVRLSDYKGKTIVVDFWATWCGPCKAEFPAYKDLEEEYGEDVHFVSVGVFCDQKAWHKMATEEGFGNNMYLSKALEPQIGEYLVNFIPRYLVIDKDFKLLDAHAPRPSSGELQAFFGNN